MNWNLFVSKLPSSVKCRAYEIYFETLDLGKREWYKEINQSLLKMVG